MGADGADAFADKVENDKKADIRFDPERGLVPLRVWAQEWLERRVVGEATRRNYEGFIRNHLVPAWDGKCWPGWRAATSRSSPRTCMPLVSGWRSPPSMTGW
ncbi:hypothetical protein [Streptomyces prasinopilosus]|uniref:hypothetical protein n=1 Tax=Streptomyces prasinopilosus TaxID=67344 RepID=UPI000AA7BE12|nr:hypothetical protein [Streptomyces prasinopilosus]